MISKGEHVEIQTKPRPTRILKRIMFGLRDCIVDLRVETTGSICLFYRRSAEFLHARLHRGYLDWLLFQRWPSGQFVCTDPSAVVHLTLVNSCSLPPPPLPVAF